MVYGKSAKDHDKNLRVVLKSLEKVGLNLNTQKCQLQKDKLKFLGYTLSAADLEPNDELVEAIVKAPIPSNVSELRSFLCLVSYCSKFTPNYAAQVEPLCLHNGKNIAFEWSSSAQKI